MLDADKLPLATEKAERAAAAEHSSADAFHGIRSAAYGDPKKQVESASQILGDKDATAQAKLAAAEKLADLHITEITIHDKTGNHNVRVEAEKGSDGKKMVHVFAEGKDGKEHVVLRGVDEGNGHISKETDSNGNEVSYSGDYWSRHEKDSTLTGVQSSNKEGEFADRVALGKIDASSHLPETIHIGKGTNRDQDVDLKRHPDGGHENTYLDMQTGAICRVQVDNKHGAIKAVEVSDPTRADGGSRGENITWQKNGNVTMTDANGYLKPKA